VLEREQAQSLGQEKQLAAALTASQAALRIADQRSSDQRAKMQVLESELARRDAALANVDGRLSGALAKAARQVQDAEDIARCSAREAQAADAQAKDLQNRLLECQSELKAAKLRAASLEERIQQQQQQQARSSGVTPRLAAAAAVESNGTPSRGFRFPPQQQGDANSSVDGKMMMVGRSRNNGSNGTFAFSAEDHALNFSSNKQHTSGHRDDRVGNNNDGPASQLPVAPPSSWNSAAVAAASHMPRPSVAAVGPGQPSPSSISTVPMVSVVGAAAAGNHRSSDAHVNKVLADARNLLQQLEAAEGAEAAGAGVALSRAALGSSTKSNSKEGGQGHTCRPPQSEAYEPLVGASATGGNKAKEELSHGESSGGIETVITELELQCVTLELEARQLAGQESKVLDRRSQLHSTLLAQRNRLLMANAPDKEVDELNQKISSVMRQIETATAQIEVNKRSVTTKLELARLQLSVARQRKGNAISK
jgi:hypothetical protein